MDSLTLVIIAGPRAGHRQEIVDGFEIGRSFGNLQIDDPKLSKKHARFVSRRGQWFVEDLGSKNQIISKGQKVSELLLTPGVEFRLGQHQFKVEKSGVIQPESTEPSDELTKTNLKTQFAPPKPLKNWREVLKEFSQSKRGLIEAPKIAVLPFNPMLKLTFLRGIQTETVWKLGYGPRKIGTASVDLTILDLESPATCFELYPEQNGVRFETQHSDLVLLNQQSISSEILKSGDEIRVGLNLLLVEYIG